MADTMRDGTKVNGARVGTAKLTEAQVLEIRAAAGTHKQIGERYGVCRQTVGLIRNRKLWAHLP